MASDAREANAVLREFVDARVDLEGLAVRLQREGVAAFDKSWQELLRNVEEKSGDDGA
jgi:transaldolase